MPASVSSTRLTPAATRKSSTARLGWAAGAGFEYAFAPHWRCGWNISTASSAAPTCRVSRRARNTPRRWISSQLRIGLNRKIDWPGSPGWSPKTDITDPESNRWEIHGQTTYLPQGYPAFRAPYTGTNSLTPARQAQATWSNSLFSQHAALGRRRGLLQSRTAAGFWTERHRRLAGFTNGEAQKSNFPYPHYNTSRLFFRQTFGFGGEQEELPSGALQLANKVDVNRLTLQAGKFAVLDIFDGNAYAKDTRKDFINWSMWAPGAFDYSADKVGLTYGATAELNQKQWALRAGYFLMQAVSNANSFDTKVFERGTYALELETR